MTGAASRPSAVVTGGSSGIGLAVAGFLAPGGYSLTICGRDPSRLREARDRLERSGGEVSGVAVGLSASFALARASMPALRRPGDRPPGWFIVSSSISASWPVPGFAAYSAAKAALLLLARSVNAEEGTSGVRACAICPAFVDTPLTGPLHGTLGPAEMLSPDDVVSAVRSCSRSRSATVGQLVIERVGAGPLSP